MVIERRKVFADRMSMARSVESLLRIDPRLESMTRAGMVLTVAAGTSVLGVRAVPREGVLERTLYARLEQEEWWQPGTIYRAAELAEQLARQLLEGWSS